MRSIEARLLADHGLSANDFETLLHLSHAERGELRRIDLAERLRLTPSGVTRLLDGLEREGLTDRGGCPTDARVTYAVITEKGRETLARAACTHAAVCEEMIGADLSPAELDDSPRCSAACRVSTTSTRVPAPAATARARLQRGDQRRELPRLVRREVAQRGADVGSDRHALRREDPLHRRLTREPLDAGPQLRE